MLGLRYLKSEPTSYLMHYAGGRVVREGVGLSFFYFAPTAVIVKVPVGTRDVPFVFNEVTADFQDVTIQGTLTCRIRDAKKIAGLLDYSVDAAGRYKSDDPNKLDERVIQQTQILARTFTQRQPLKDVLVNSDALIAEVLEGLRKSTTLDMLGIEVLGLSILGLKPAPEMAKALQAGAREEMLRQADEAIYARRNVAVELERTIKENELNTEIAIEQKKQQMRESQLVADIAVEQQRSTLVDARVENERKEADARAAGLQAVLEPLKSVDWKTLIAMNTGLDSRMLISLAFQQIAQNAEKIGELSISPDLLNSLVRPRDE
ncbi:MAG: SPFH domain-containing protein [Planctomycetota bacterium]|nr:SPFH domain-containing protein [Planctomycetota bacterium]